MNKSQPISPYDKHNVEDAAKRWRVCHWADSSDFLLRALYPVQYTLNFPLSGIQLLQFTVLSADHQKLAGSCSMLQVISSAGDKTAAAVGPQITADTATGSGTKKGLK